MNQEYGERAYWGIADDEPMNNKRTNGGAAFPSCNADGDGPPGMTLRDWFAGHTAAAVTGHLIGGTFTEIDEDAEKIEEVRLIAKLAYHMADAMLAAREEHP